MPTDPPGDVRTASSSAARPVPSGSAETNGFAHHIDDPALGRIVVTETEIRERIAELGAEIAADYADSPPLLVGVLKGAFVFMADMARAIRLPVPQQAIFRRRWSATCTTPRLTRPTTRSPEFRPGLSSRI